MKKRSFIVFIGLSIIAILGLFAMQIIWLDKSLQQERENYEKLVSYGVYLIDSKIMSFMSPDYAFMDIDPQSAGIPDNINKQATDQIIIASELIGYYKVGNDSIPAYKTRYTNENIDFYELDSIINNVISTLSLEKEYAFGVFDKITDTLKYTNTPGFDFRNSSYISKITIRNSPKVGNPQLLRLFIPQGKSVLIRRIGHLLGANILLMSLIAGAFIYALIIILKQKKINEIRKDFISSMSHEFRTPVSSVSLTLEGLMNHRIQEDPNKTGKYISIAYKEIRRLGMMIEKVLNIASFENGMIRIIKSDIDINELINEIANTFEIHINHKGGEIIKELQTDGLIIRGDREHLTQAIYNLLDNANKYSPEKPVITIRTRMDEKSNYLYIEISDQGVGIMENKLRDIFKPYNRIRNNKVIYRGFGLGLSYVAEVIKLHSGEISVQSKLNTGSSFILKLPLI